MPRRPQKAEDIVPGLRVEKPVSEADAHRVADPLRVGIRKRLYFDVVERDLS
jgi:hypothetical protein